MELIIMKIQANKVKKILSENVHEQIKSKYSRLSKYFCQAKVKGSK